MPLLINSVISSQDINLMRQLESEGASFDHSDYSGCYPIHICVINGDLEGVKFLIKQGVNLDQHNRDGLSALYLAIFKNEKEIV